MIDLYHGFFLVRVYKDYLHVLPNGPWVERGHYLTVCKWRPNFRPSKYFSSTLVWVRLPEIPISFFNEPYLSGKKVVKAVRADQCTVDSSRGLYARVCVEVELKKQRVPSFVLMMTSRGSNTKDIHWKTNPLAKFSKEKSQDKPLVERLKDIDWNGKRDTKWLRFPQITYSKGWTGKDKELSAFKLHELVRSGKNARENNH